MSTLATRYNEALRPELMKKLDCGVMEAPRLVKITLNMGLGEAVADKKILENAVEDMAKIAGQKPIVTYARKSVAGFKIREGWPIGAKVTLRRAQASSMSRTTMLSTNSATVSLPNTCAVSLIERTSWRRTGPSSMP